MYRIRGEWCLREMDLNPEIFKTRRGLLTWLAVALGLKNPNDGRDGVVYVLEALFSYCLGRGSSPTFEEIKGYVGRKFLERGRSAPSDEAIRHHLRRMIKMGIVERDRGRYCLARNPLKPDDPSGFVDVLFERLEKVKKLIKAAVRDIKSLY
jgi:hypothetical protein